VLQYIGASVAGGLLFFEKPSEAGNWFPLVKPVGRWGRRDSCGVRTGDEMKRS